MSKEEIVDGSMKNKITSSDLLNERKNRDFDISTNPFIEILDKGYLKSQENNWEMIKNDPII
jgi:hypothetical protein